MHPEKTAMKTVLFSLLLAFVASVPLFAQESASSSLAGILPAKIEDAKGKSIESSTLEGKYVGLYFSAHWCPPCRAFTPSLVKFRDKHADEDFEIVFVSLDNSEKEKKGYIREMKMNWPSIRGARSRDGEGLSKRFGISGIPALIILAPDGSVVTENGRGDVSASPDTALAKWKEKKNPS
jgi:nucleoredoxin